MRNLEEAYKKSQQEEVPDLWARIENNLPEKKKKKRIVSMTPYLSVAAAALFLCILIPGMSRLTKNQDASTENAFDCAAADAASGGVDGGVMEETEMKDMFAEDVNVEESVKEEADINTSFDSMEEEMCMQSTSKAPITDAENASASVGQTEQKAPADDAADNMWDMETVISDDILQEVYTVQNFLSAGGENIAILSSGDGQTLRALVPQESELFLEIGTSYLFTLEKQGGTDWDYVVTEVTLK